MLVDSHCHAFAVWPDGIVPDPQTRGDIRQLIYELDRNHVDKAMVLAGGTANGENSAYVAEALRDHADRLILFPDIDCYWSNTYHHPGAADRLADVVRTYAPRGITHYLRDDDDGSWLVSREARSFFELIAINDMIVSIHVRPHQLEHLRTLAAAFPATPFLIHHLGFPLFEQPGTDAALEEIERCAETPNVHLKISGFDICNEEPWEYPYSSVGAMARKLIDAFGCGRCHWGSNFPMCSPSMTYRQAVECVRLHIDWRSDAEMMEVMGSAIWRLLAKVPSIIPGGP